MLLKTELKTKFAQKVDHTERKTWN